MGDSDCEAVPDCDCDCLLDAVGEVVTVCDRDADKQRDAELVSDAIVAEGESVPPPSAPSGLILAVERCVPAMENSADAETTDGVTVGVERPVTTCRGGEGVREDSETKKRGGGGGSPSYWGVAPTQSRHTHRGRR